MRLGAEEIDHVGIDLGSNTSSFTPSYRVLRKEARLFSFFSFLYGVKVIES